jgi:hypothetical protein
VEHLAELINHLSLRRSMQSDSQASPSPDPSPSPSPDVSTIDQHPPAPPSLPTIVSPSEDLQAPSPSPDPSPSPSPDVSTIDQHPPAPPSLPTMVSPSEDLQARVDAAASGDVLVLAPGVYTPAADARIGLRITKGITLAAERPLETILDGQGSRVVLHLITSGTVVLVGLIITNGYSNSSLTHGFTSLPWTTDIHGGGVLIDGTHAELNNCVVVNNSARWGAGICIRGGDVNATGCDVQNNHDTGPYRGTAVGAHWPMQDNGVTVHGGNNGHWGSGNGIFVTRGGGASCVVSLTNCMIRNHTCTYSAGGGGLFNHDADVTLVDCEIYGNYVMNQYVDSACLGGGIKTEGGTMSVVRCTFHDNRAGRGAGLYIGDSTVTVRDSTFDDNVAARYHGYFTTLHGGAIFISGPSRGSLTVEGSLFSRNRAEWEGQVGGLYANAATALVLNSNTWLDNCAELSGRTHTLFIGTAVQDSVLFNNTFLVSSACNNQGVLFEVQPATPNARFRCELGTYMPEMPLSMPLNLETFTGCKEVCPSGTFGATDNLTEARCSGPCTPGHYCSRGAAQPVGVERRALNTFARQGMQLMRRGCNSHLAGCPQGTHLPPPPVIGYSLHSCLPCIPGTYNPNAARSDLTCIPCVATRLDLFLCTH